MSNLRSSYKEGEIIQCIKDRSAKAIFGDINNIEITTMLVSMVLKIPYEKLVGNISLLPLTIRENSKEEKLPECDVVIYVNVDNEERIVVLEFNYFTQDLESFFKKKKLNRKEKRKLSKAQQLKLNRNLFYIFKMVSSRLKEGDSYSKIIPVTLVNFDTFSKKNKKLNKYGVIDVLDSDDYYSENLEIFNLDVVKCYQAVYNDKYQGSSIFEDNLIKLGAMMATDNIEEVNELIRALNTEKIVKDKMTEVISKMMQDGMLSLYYYPDEEQKRLDDSLLDLYKQEGEKIGFKRGEKRGEKRGLKIGEQRGLKIGEQRGLKIGEERLANKEKEMVINMYKDNALIEKICKYVNLPIKKVNEIIEDYKSNLK